MGGVASTRVSKQIANTLLVSLVAFARPLVQVVKPSANVRRNLLSLHASACCILKLGLHSTPVHRSKEVCELLHIISKALFCVVVILFFLCSLHSVVAASCRNSGTHQTSQSLYTCRAVGHVLHNNRQSSAVNSVKAHHLQGLNSLLDLHSRVQALEHTLQFLKLASKFANVNICQRTCNVTAILECKRFRKRNRRNSAAFLNQDLLTSSTLKAVKELTLQRSILVSQANSQHLKLGVRLSHFKETINHLLWAVNS